MQTEYKEQYKVTEARMDKTPEILFKDIYTGAMVHLFIHADTVEQEKQFESWLVSKLKEIVEK